jgi:hypothetical protein
MDVDAPVVFYILTRLLASEYFVNIGRDVYKKQLVHGRRILRCCSKEAITIYMFT